MAVRRSVPPDRDGLWWPWKPPEGHGDNVSLSKEASTSAPQLASSPLHPDLDLVAHLVGKELDNRLKEWAATADHGDLRSQTNGLIDIRLAIVAFFLGVVEGERRNCGS